MRCEIVCCLRNFKITMIYHIIEYNDRPHYLLYHNNLTAIRLKGLRQGGIQQLHIWHWTQTTGGSGLWLWTQTTGVN